MDQSLNLLYEFILTPPVSKLSLHESSSCECVCGSSNQIIVRSNAKEFSEITEGDGGVGLKPEVTVVMCWSQITSFTVAGKNRDGVMSLCFIKYKTWQAAHYSV